MKNSLIWGVVAVVVVALLFWRLNDGSNAVINTNEETGEVSTTTQPVTTTKPSTTKPAPVTGMKVSLGGI